MNTFTPMLAAAGQAHSTLTGLDWLMIALYFGILLGVASYVVRHAKDTAADYFLAGRNLGWWIIGASIFASIVIETSRASGAEPPASDTHPPAHRRTLMVRVRVIARTAPRWKR